MKIGDQETFFKKSNQTPITNKVSMVNDRSMYTFNPTPYAANYSLLDSLDRYNYLVEYFEGNSKQPTFSDKGVGVCDSSVQNGTFNASATGTQHIVGQYASGVRGAPPTYREHMSRQKQLSEYRTLQHETNNQLNQAGRPGQKRIGDGNTEGQRCTLGSVSRALVGVSPVECDGNFTVGSEGQSISAAQPVVKPNTYICKECGYRAKQKSYLRQHIFTHTKTSKIQCRHVDCGDKDKCFRNQSDLNRHLFTKHFKIKPYRCMTCNKAFGRQDHLKQHLSTRTHQSAVLSKGSKIAGK